MNRGLFVILIFVCMSVCLQAVERDSVTLSKELSHYIFKDTLDKECSLGDLKGNYVFLEIWSMSCGPCLRQMSYFEELSQVYKDKSICFISICVENNFPLWKNFLKQKGMIGTHWITPILSPFLRENGFMAVPRFVLLDKESRILWGKAKQPSDPELKKELDRVLN